MIHRLIFGPFYFFPNSFYSFTFGTVVAFRARQFFVSSAVSNVSTYSIFRGGSSNTVPWYVDRSFELRFSLKLTARKNFPIQAFHGNSGSDDCFSLSGAQPNKSERSLKNVKKLMAPGNADGKLQGKIILKQNFSFLKKKL